MASTFTCIPQAFLHIFASKLLGEKHGGNVVKGMHVNTPSLAYPHLKKKKKKKKKKKLYINI